MLLPLYIRTWQQEMQSLRVPPRSVTTFRLKNQSLLGARVFYQNARNKRFVFLPLPLCFALHIIRTLCMCLLALSFTWFH